jgi:hypothetical protein
VLLPKNGFEFSVICCPITESNNPIIQKNSASQGEMDGYLIEVPNFENGFLVKQRVLEEAVSGGESKMVALGDGTIRVHKLLKEIKIMTTHRITHIDWTTTNGP